MAPRTTTSSWRGPATAEPSVWMVSPGFDLFFFIFTSVAVLAPYLASQHYKIAPHLIIAAVAIAANGPHLVSTWTRVYLDREERARRPWVYWGVPVLITIAVFALTLKGGKHLAALRTVLLFWAIWHFTQQNWGILRIYQRKAGEADLPISRLERALLYLGVLLPMSIRMREAPLFLFGSKIWHPTFQPWMTHALVAAFVVGGGFYLVQRARQVLRGHRVGVMRPLFIAASAFAFYVPFVMIKNGSAAFACAALWHGLQYIGIVWFYNRNRWKAGVSRTAPLVSWVSQPGRVWAYALTLMVMAACTYGVLRLLVTTSLDIVTWSTIVWTSLTFSHYWVDGFIWKLRKPELRRNLVAQPAA